MAVAGSLTYDTKIDEDGFKKGFASLQSAGTAAFKALAAGAAAVTAALGAIVVASVKARGELEQQIGGVETLFKDNADFVIENANKAYKTAGLSATEYMENVTSFSASLLQSTAGDTKKAAEIADMAMIDMADNANKMGTDMSMIQSAYQRFCKTKLYYVG